MNCRDPTATPSVMLPSVTAEVLAMLRASPMLHSGDAASRSFTKKLTSVSSGFRSAPTLPLATSKSCRKGSTKVVHDVTVVHVPLILPSLRFSATRAADHGHR